MSEEKEKQGSMCLCLVCNCSGAECQVKSEIARLQTINAKLLEALEDCRDVLEDYAHIVPFLQARERAEAAIAKAKGEK